MYTNIKKMPFGAFPHQLLVSYKFVPLKISELFDKKNSTEIQCLMRSSICFSFTLY